MREEHLITDRPLSFLRTQRFPSLSSRVFFRTDGTGEESGSVRRWTKRLFTVLLRRMAGNDIGIGFMRVLGELERTASAGEACIDASVETRSIMIMLF